MTTLRTLFMRCELMSMRIDSFWLSSDWCAAQLRGTPCERIPGRCIISAALTDCQVESLHSGLLVCWIQWAPFQISSAVRVLCMKSLDHLQITG
jgi:hypothetical protein